MSLLFEQETYALRSAIFDVYFQMGNGFLESVYQECLKLEFRARNIPFITQPNLALMYKDQLLKQSYKPDFICFDQIIIELKAVNLLKEEHKAQLMNYLKITGMKLGLLVNFGAFPKVEIKRIIM
ncbi:GxxExxY protein [Actinobacillus suis]|uniref:GxxExxY protein n=1 Tax=Actinobacillus suis TaxID=716 RepID=UPI0020B6C57D|nr:GxxExxY protein [Actinobacillus suis]UTH25296.1 GxxExxY protein [Actinobacillus suis]